MQLTSSSLLCSGSAPPSSIWIRQFVQITPAASEERFEKEIRPILVRDASPAWLNEGARRSSFDQRSLILRVDQEVLLLAPGKPDQSLLIRAIESAAI